MPKFYPIKIKSLTQETPDCKSILLDIPKALEDTFAYQAGQYITFKASINGEELRRSYSLCSSPLENQWRVAVKQIPEGRFSTYANHSLQVGDILEAMPPMGNFTPEINPSHQKHYLAIAAGSGITPVLSIMKSVLKAEPKSRFTLFLGNRNVQSIIFKEEIEGLKNTYIQRLEVYHFLTRELGEVELFNGRLSKQKITEALADLVNVADIDAFFVCGPEDIIFNTKEVLENQGVEKSKIHFELFTTPGEKKARKTQKINPLHQGKTSKITIKDGGKQFIFDMTMAEGNILDAALKQGADLPYACKGGVCCTCKAKIEEGEVEMQVNYALEPEEVEAGFTLTCQAIPLTDEVVVNFDEAL